MPCPRRSTRPAAAPGGRLARGLRPGRARRGFTLIELGIVMTIGAALFLLTLRWMFGFAQTSAANLDATGPLRTASYATTLLRQDITRAQVCAPYGLGAPLADLGADTFSVYADDNGDGTLDLVSWRVTGGQLQRAVSPGAGDCTFDTSARTWVTVADHVNPAPAYFTGYQHGTAQAGYPTSCTKDPASCLDDSLGVHLVITSPTTIASSALVNGTWPLNTSGSRL